MSNGKLLVVSESSVVANVNFPKQVNHARPHFFFCEWPIPGNDLHHTPVRHLIQITLVDVQVEVLVVLDARVLSFVRPIQAAHDQTFSVATHYNPLSISDFRWVGMCSDPSGVVSQANTLVMVPVKKIRMIVRENTCLVELVQISGYRTNRKVRSHDLAKIIATHGAAGEVGPFRPGCSPEVILVFLFHLDIGRALGHTTLPSAHGTRPYSIGVLALEPGHHRRLCCRLKPSLKSPVQVLHAVPKLRFSE
mmetsp:Transcript_57010/g.79080  ORF Transcript_57010/g.79080 Transcript_57010/m.79080 type:complete len:250 (-) Transcript_57010:447-1196(-)